MAQIYYTVVVSLNILLMLIYAAMWQKQFDINFTLIFTLIGVTSLGYAFQAQAHSLQEAYIGLKIIYLGGCYLPLFITLSIFGLCSIPINGKLRLLMIGLSTGLYFCILTIGYLPWFYRSASLIQMDGISLITEKVYGPLHLYFYILMILYSMIGFAAIIYSYFRKKEASNRVLLLLLLTEVVSVSVYFLEKIYKGSVDLVPATYSIAGIFYLLIIHRVCYYNVTDAAINSLVQEGETGFMNFDFRGHYLGSNETAKLVFPALKELKIDSTADRNHLIAQDVLPWIQAFRENEENHEMLYHKEDRTYQITLGYLYVGKRRIGYQFFITDDTKNQQYLSLLKSYNAELEEEVAEKTSHLVEMHDRLIMGMAVMVESRDNSTGGHIRRTSDVVKILVEEIKKDPQLQLTDAFCAGLIKAAPMHDLGKIAVDDQILRKPGRYTPEEYDEMKKHAAEGAKIVSRILEGTDDGFFRDLAINVAHYHHERWDGSGYPDGLQGTEIPLEARIMAIADVYDALVSKRVYKEKMSPEQADEIIRAGMGCQFDSSLAPAYERAVPKLRRYYEETEP